ncbi:MAG: putative 4-hydroxybenzoate polyprenyltransferase [Desulfuromonadales bacterium]|nr:putative 4-hydroxybenzoate polyprenyltransferase [Desulfuromonadales bacterium]
MQKNITPAPYTEENKGFAHRIVVFLEMIKFPHTVFALPFAFTGALLAANGIPSWDKVLWIIVAMVGARTAAMGLNRLIDAEIDGKNPRTKGRAIPAGFIGKGTVAFFVALSLLILIYAAYRLNPLCLKLSPIAIFFLFLYSYSKRFTSFAHLILGLCLGAAPMGAWVAIRGDLGLPAILLGAAVTFWTAGFDILYALQDLEFDKKEGLYSIPVKLGVNGSLWLARIFHIIMFGLLVGIYFRMQLGNFFIAGLAISFIMIFYEHWLLRKGDLTKLDAAFFNMNGYISVTIFIATLLDRLIT